MNKKCNGTLCVTILSIGSAEISYSSSSPSELASSLGINTFGCDFFLFKLCG